MKSKIFYKNERKVIFQNFDYKCRDIVFHRKHIYFYFVLSIEKYIKTAIKAYLRIIYCDL